MIVEKLEKSVNNFLQQTVTFSVNGRPLKTGKLILFCIKDFYLVFTLQVQNSKKHFEIPYPFKYVQEDNKIILDYTLKQLCQNNINIETNAKLLSTRKPSKYFNTHAEISVVELSK